MGLTGSAAAGESHPAPVSVPAPAAPLRLVVSGDMPRILETSALCERLATELRVPVVLAGDLGSAPDSGVLRIAYDAAAGSLSVAYAPVEGALLTRTIPASADSGEAADLAVLLAGNLARDQAAELLAESRPPPTFAAESTREAATSSPTDATVLSRWFDAAAPVLGHLETEAWTSNLSLVNVGARLSGRHLYGLLSLSAQLESWRPLAGPGLTLGAADRCPRFECGVDIGTAYLVGGSGPPDGYTLDRLISRVRAHLAIAPRPGLTLFAGAGYALTTHLYHVPANDRELELFAGVRL
ncbi:MAG TPA: hypothetical protein VGP64_16280 [Polyangia bacterium]